LENSLARKKGCFTQDQDTLNHYLFFSFFLQTIFSLKLKLFRACNHPQKDEKQKPLTIKKTIYEKQLC